MHELTWSGLQPSAPYEVSLTSGTVDEPRTVAAGDTEYERFEQFARSLIRIPKAALVEKSA